jgi:hypothetical protein
LENKLASGKMQLTVSTDDERVVMVEVDPDELVENVKAILEVEVIQRTLGVQVLKSRLCSCPHNMLLTHVHCAIHFLEC